MVVASGVEVVVVLVSGAVAEVVVVELVVAIGLFIVTGFCNGLCDNAGNKGL